LFWLSAVLVGAPNALVVCWLLVEPNAPAVLVPPNKLPPEFALPNPVFGAEPNALFPEVLLLLLVLPNPPKPPDGAAVAVLLPKRPPPAVVVAPPNAGLLC